MNSIKNSNESNNLAVLLWLGTLVCIFISPLMFVPSLIFYFVKKEDYFILEHAKEALNFSITVLLAGLISAILMIVLIGFLLAIVVVIFAVIVCILGAIAASKGEMYRAPLCLRLFK